MLHKYPFPNDNTSQYILKLAHINVHKSEVSEYKHKYAKFSFFILERE